MTEIPKDNRSHNFESIFGSIFGDIGNAMIDREGVAKTFDYVAEGLREGLDPENVAIICNAFAEVVRAPEAHLEIARRTFTRINERLP